MKVIKVLNGNPLNRVKIPLDFLENSQLSFQAKGMLGFLLANKEDDINVFDLVTKSKNGRDATRNTLNELIAHGYIYAVKLRNSAGQYYGIQYHIYPNGRKISDEP